MGYQTRRPVGRLQGIVDRFWRVDDPAADGAPETICPDGRTEIVLHLGDSMRQRVVDIDIRQPRHLLVAQMDRPITIVPCGHVSMIGARFVAGALHRRLPVPQDRLAGRILDLEDVWSRWTRRTADRVASASTVRAFDEFERALEELLPAEDAAADRSIDVALARLRATGGTVSIEGLANAIGIGRRQFERRFMERVGLPPRLFGRIVRFHRASRLLGTAGGAEIAAACGYADQPHMVREMRRFAGRTPTELADAGGLTEFLSADFAD